MKWTGVLLAGAVVLLAGGPCALADYATYISSTNPVGWWGFNDAGGVTNAPTTADLSGAYGAANNGLGANVDMAYGQPGTLVQSNRAGCGLPGMVAGNKAAFFNGQQPWITLAGAAGNGPTGADPATEAPVYRYTTGFSGEAWIKRSSPTGADDQVVMSGREWKFGFTDDGNHLRFTTWAVSDYFGNLLPKDGAWHQIGFSFDGDKTCSFYLDGAAAGVSVATGAGLRAVTNPGYNTFCLGRNQDTTGSGGSQQFRGSLDEAVIWNAPRLAEDFAASWAAAHTRSFADMTATPSGPFDFGAVGVSTISAPRTVTLSNISTLGVNITAASVTGGFAFTFPLPGTPTYALAPGAIAVYGIELPAQTTPGHYAGTATFVTDIADGAGFKTFTYALSADVVAHAGDVNGDGQVSLLDYNVIKAHFGNAYESGSHWNDGDVNADGQVGLLDFNIVKAHFGHTTGDGVAATAVPEPASILGLLSVIPILSGLKRRAKA